MYHQYVLGAGGGAGKRRLLGKPLAQSLAALYAPP
jgi:hypothetical protein